MPPTFALRCRAVLTCCWVGAAVMALSACDALGIESNEQMAAKKEAEGKAVGSACRHALRAIEDCYVLNPKALKSAVFAGWREMDEYMRENKLEGIAPTVPRPGDKPAGSEEKEEVIETPPAKAGKAAKH